MRLRSFQIAMISASRSAGNEALKFLCAHGSKHGLLVVRIVHSKPTNSSADVHRMSMNNAMIFSPRSASVAATNPRVLDRRRIELL